MTTGRSALTRWQLVSTALIAAVVLMTSLVGLGTSWAYDAETTNWRLQAQGQDLGNLVAVVVLGLSAMAAARGSVRGVQIWAGCLLYLVYAFVIYALAVHFGPLFLAYVAVLGLSSFSALFALLRRGFDVTVTGTALATGCRVLVVIGVLFALLWLSEIVPAVASGSVPASLTEAGLAVNPVHVLDLSVVLPGMVWAGVTARRGDRGGLLLLAPWLTFSALMGLSILAAMALISHADLGASVPATTVVGLVVVASVSALWRVLRSTETRVPLRPT